ncbi:MAG: zf-HC2 domain-containing protein [Chloroflexi bacterium]|nr:zf-HC2 domain-containing protein [Chloroflexota bacterium]
MFLTAVLKRLGLRRRVDCAELRRQASALLEGGLSDQERELLKRHLEECGNCSRFVATLQATLALLRDLPRRAMPEALKLRLRGVSQDYQAPSG